MISRAFDDGVKAIINVGVDLKRSRKSIEIAKKHKSIYVSVGLHPDNFVERGTHNVERNWKEKLKKLAKNKKVVAIGECGLDYFHITHDMEHRTQELEKIKENQKAGFVAQIDLAKELGLPVIVHCREAWDDLFGIISASSKTLTKFVLHCYSGGKEDTKKFLKLPNVWFSFSGNITYPKPAERAEKLTEAVRMIPLDRIMLDSDAPFLASQEYRGKRNEPAYVKYIAQKIADTKKISADVVEKITDKNAEKFFGI